MVYYRNYCARCDIADTVHPVIVIIFRLLSHSFMCMIESVRDAFRIIVPLLVHYKVFVWLAPLIVRLRPVDQTRQRVMIEGFNTLSYEHKLVIFLRKVPLIYLGIWDT